ncbi:hypothetical protein [Salibaculum sp.]|uniref:hypothetical protein n=1 Tax=Salibaculum sp. TaxID=2855480 RepID=UPI002B479645|nr:hypothetical protein [Salibaculum sp.]HKL68204.1 hypothetical protein [Salibaculum sp.]
MPSDHEDLARRIRELEDALAAELAQKRQRFQYRLERSRVVFNDEVIARHRAARERLSSFLSRTRFLVVVTAPAIYILIVPFVLLDLMVSFYQAVCFPVYGIPKVPRRDHIVIDRHRLAYLNGLQKLNCIYCGYANGVIGWVREVASRTEAYWCPIKHSQPVMAPHGQYHRFPDFGDDSAFREQLSEIRQALKRDDPDPD